MRTKEFRLHHERRIKRKIIERLKADYWRWHEDAEVDWENLTDHVGKRELCPRWGRYWFTDSAIEADSYLRILRKRKPYNNAPKWFKQRAQRRRRAKVNDKMVNEDYENIPRFKKTNNWDWD